MDGRRNTSTNSTDAGKHYVIRKTKKGKEKRPEGRFAAIISVIASAFPFLLMIIKIGICASISGQINIPSGLIRQKTQHETRKRRR